MTGVWRPTLEQLMRVASDVLAAPVSELATPEVLRRGRFALAAPNAEYHGVELYAEIPRKAAAFVGALLANPLPGRQVPRIACRALAGILHRNGWIWPVSPAATIIRFENELRSGEVGAELAEWIMKHATQDPQAPLSEESSLSLFAADDRSNSHVIYQAGPVTGLSDEAHRLQIELGRRFEVAVAEAAQATGALLELEHPSLRFSPQRSPGVSDQEFWHLNRKLMLSRADALVIADVGERGPAVGAAMEIDLMASQGGPILYLRQKDRGPCSRYFTGRAEELDFSIYDYDSPAEAASYVCDWLVERVRAIEEAGRRRVDRMYEGELLLKRLRPAYDSLADERKMFISGTLNISSSRVDAALEHPAVTSIVLGEQQTAFCELVGLEEGISGEGMESSIPNAPRAETLIEAAKIMGWSAEKTHSLWNEAMHEWETVTIDRRFPAQTVTDWIERGRG